MAEEDTYAPDVSSACTLSPSAPSTVKTSHDMQLKLQAWKQEKAAKAAQEKAAKSQKPQPFRVPCTTSSPLRTRAPTAGTVSTVSTASSENVPCSGGPPQAKTPSKTRPAPNRTALTERCPNTDAGSRTPFAAGARSVSPPPSRYAPAPRTLRPKTPERARTPKTPDRRAPKTPEPRRVRTPEPTTSQAAAQQSGPGPSAPVASAEAQEPDAAIAATEDAIEEEERPAVDVSKSVPVETNEETQVVREESEALPVERDEEVIGTVESGGALEANCHMCGACRNTDQGEAPGALTSADVWQCRDCWRKQYAARSAEDEATPEVKEDEERKPILGLGAADSSATPPPPLTRIPAPAGPPPELRVVEEQPRQEASEESSDASSETCTDEEQATSQKAAEEEQTSAVAASASELATAKGPAEEASQSAQPDVGEVAARSPTVTCRSLGPRSPPAVPDNGNLLAAYLPAASPCTRASPSVAARVGGGLLAAYEERAALPKMPPPSPATPSETLAYALATASTMPDLANAEAAEFARAAGAALHRLASEEDTSAPSASPRASPAAEIPRSPACNKAETRSPAEPPSPLSLESGSPARDREDEVKLES